ncbi:purine-nucleoside phosphorylase [Pararhizobium mangrovi]|uniref:Purine nucleoside phosphorylase n=1 Tax=Pararhizobium mangrovi TaxID=2590452 RepID=A0A506UI45_9HYPH|nr:purine-nucleoside phosphorylase [Pararhizobium mangrovi]TPW32963.1 purine-nucleoside phosphorylase [Pararhizobium mangrovi]
MTPAAEALKARLGGLSPRHALVLGSGLGTLVEAIADPVRVSYADLPGFPVSSVSGHAGEIVAGTIGGTPVVALSGRVHFYETGDPAAMRPAIETLRDLGVETLILTNAAGSLKPDMPPGSVMRIADHINFSGWNPLMGTPDAPFEDGRFVGMSSAYDQPLAEAMRKAAKRIGVELHEGVYMWFSGPSFETPAEIRMARTLGADAVGMSTVPEVILARFFGLRVAAASVITNLGAGMDASELSHAETKEMAPVGGKRLAALLTALFEEEAP